MPVYEIVNPSDAVTYATDNPTALQIGFLQLCSSGGIALRDVETDEYLRPMMLFWDDAKMDEWVKKNLPENCGTWLAENRSAVADALESVLYGGTKDRQLFDSMVAGKSPEEVRKLRVQWNDKKRSSVTDYSTPSLAYADKLRKLDAAK